MKGDRMYTQGGEFREIKDGCQYLIENIKDGSKYIGEY
jgi:hypothetical protein